MTGYKLSARAAAAEERYRSASVLPLSASAQAASVATATPGNVAEARLFGDDFWAALGGMSSADRAEEAAKVSAVFFCCSLIAVIIGSLPREFRGADGLHDEGMPLNELLNETPNFLQTGDEFWSSLAYRAALDGAAYAEPIVRFDQAEIWPLDPLRSNVDWEDRDFRLHYLPERGQQRIMRPMDLFWFAGLADCAARPLTPWKMAKGSIDFALALEKQGRDFFSNGSRLAGLLSTEMVLTDEAIERIRAGIQRWKSGGIPVLEQGLTFKDVASNNSDSQMAELIKQRTLEMARYWHIPKSLVGEESGGKSNHEQEALDFVKYCIRPWVRRIEQAVRARLMSPDQRARWKFKINLDALLRGDSATQFRNAVLARTASTHSINDLRGWFGLPRISESWANDVRMPLNSNRAADTVSGGETAPQDQQSLTDVRRRLVEAGIDNDTIAAVMDGIYWPDDETENVNA